MLCARLVWGTKMSKWQTSFVCYGGKTYCCVPFHPSYSSKAPMTYCFDFGGIWYLKTQRAHSIMECSENSEYTT